MMAEEMMAEFDPMMADFDPMMDAPAEPAAMMEDDDLKKENKQASAEGCFQIDEILGIEGNPYVIQNDASGFLSVELKEALKGVETVGIYFSASWCPPCKTFTPKLIEFYNKVNENKKVFEIIFVA